MSNLSFYRVTMIVTYLEHVGRITGQHFVLVAMMMGMMMLMTGCKKVGQIADGIAYWERLSGLTMETGELLFFFRQDLIAVVLETRRELFTVAFVDIEAELTVSGMQLA